MEYYAKFMSSEFGQNSNNYKDKNKQKQIKQTQTDKVHLLANPADRYIFYNDTAETQLFLLIWRQSVFMKNKCIVEELVPAEENWIPDSSCSITHNPKGLSMQNKKQNVSLKRSPQ